MNQKQYYQSYFEDLTGRTNPLWSDAKIDTSGKSLIFATSEVNPIYLRNNDDNLMKFDEFNVYENIIESNGKQVVLSNLRMKRVFYKDYSGLCIATNTEAIEIYTKPTVLSILYNELRKYTIQHDFYRNYYKQKLIGKGSFAKVYQIKNKNDKNSYAAKQFSKEKLGGDKINQEAILNEINIMRQLSHQHILKMYEVFEDEKYIHLILEYLEGGELLKAIDAQYSQYDEILVQNVMWKLLNAIYYLHNKEIIHRDLKPENIILKEKNNVEELVIADFGLAEKYSEKGDYLFPKCGTVGYIAPEVYLGKSYDYKVDIYALGVIMFLLLSGELPYQGSETDQIIESSIHPKINYNKLKQLGISNNGIELCKGMLEVNPTNRFTASQTLDHDWFHVPLLKTFNLLSLKMIQNVNPKFKDDLYKTNKIIWQNSSINSLLDSSPLSAQSSNFENDNFQLQDQIWETKHDLPSIELKKKLNKKSKSEFEDDYEVIEDIVPEEKSPKILVEKHKLVVRQVFNKYLK